MQERLEKLLKRRYVLKKQYANSCRYNTSTAKRTRTRLEVEIQYCNAVIDEMMSCPQIMHKGDK